MTPKSTTIITRMSTKQLWVTQLLKTKFYEYSRTIIQEFIFNIFNMNPSLNQTQESNLDDSIDSGNFPVRYYLPSIWKYLLLICIPFSQYLSLENSGFLLMFFTVFTSLSLLLLFPLSITSFIFMQNFDAISSDIDEVLLISPSVNVFVLGDFNVNHKDWHIYFGGTDRPGELCYNFSIIYNPKWPYSDG